MGRWKPRTPVHVSFTARVVKPGASIREHAREIDADGMAFISGEAPGAFPNGTRVVKCNSGEKGHPDGTRGRILASHSVAEFAPQFLETMGPFSYFVEWDPTPGVPVGCGSRKVRAEEQG